MPSDICFNCGKLSKFLVTYPELENSVKANHVSTSPSNIGSTNFKKGWTRNRRERKLEHRANRLPVAEDIQIHYDVWRDLAEEESAPLDDDLNLHYLGHDLMEELDMGDDLNLHYLGHNLMEELDMAADHQFMTDIDEDARAENADDEDEAANYADDEDSEYGDADSDFFASKKLVEMARRCITLQWEPSAPVERISRKAQPLYNDLCGWNFADAISCARSGATLVEDNEISPLTSPRRFSFDFGCESFTSAPKSSFDDGYELDRQFLDSMDWDRNSNCSSSATVRNQLVECRHMVGGRVYEWDIFL
ncbi:hypothetical protein JMJ35_008181 [Cladonia borealis]|uniref:Uncharacterized protein n=1 Tax=Cladonia borealis TaxID=184061 RepID=A0AA39UZI7_9LECA|nr:hypothetical protein JMJ35_008181 [Cladonia borealis]